MMMQEHFNKTGQNFVSRTQQKQYNTISAQMYQPRAKKVVMQSDVVKEKFGDPEAEGEDGEQNKTLGQATTSDLQIADPIAVEMNLRPMTAGN